MLETVRNAGGTGPARAQLTASIVAANQAAGFLGPLPKDNRTFHDHSGKMVPTPKYIRFTGRACISYPMPGRR